MNRTEPITYLKPECGVAELQTGAQLLAGSNENWGEEGLNHV